MKISDALRLAVIATSLWGGIAAGVASAETISSEKLEFSVTKVVQGLAHPWSMAFLSNGDILITERIGRLRVVRNGELDPGVGQGSVRHPAAVKGTATGGQRNGYTDCQ